MASFSVRATRISLRRLKEVFNYNPTTGIFRWKESPNRRIKIGSVAGSDCAGYVSLKVDGVACAAHILAWFYVHGVRPPIGIDHRNGDWRDNRICNLRLASQSMNMANKRKARSGLKGITLDKRVGRYQAKIGKNGKQWHIGMFATEEAAHAAYWEAAQAEFGEFARAE